MDESTPTIEQAVFAVNLGFDASGSRRATRVSEPRTTSGALDEDVAELSRWASRVELPGNCVESTNLFFFPLPSGAFAIGRLTPGSESFANSRSFYFQSLIVPDSVFWQCGANPIAIYREAINTTRFGLYRRGAKLEPFSISVKLCCVDSSEVLRGVSKIGVRALSRLTQSTLESLRTSFVVGPKYRAFLVVSDLFGLTPIYWRPKLTFAVGVSFRGETPLRLTGTTVRSSGDVGEAGRNSAFFDLRDVQRNEDAYPLGNGWAAFVELALRSKRLYSFYCRLAEDYVVRRQDGDDPDVGEIDRMGFEQEKRLEDEIQKGEEVVDEDFDATSFNVDDDESEDEPAFSASTGEWRETEDDRDWGFGDGDIWRVDGDEADEENGASERGGVEIIDDSSDSSAEAEQGARRNDVPTIPPEVRDRLSRVWREELDEARRASKRVEPSGLNGGDGGRKSARENDVRNEKEKSFEINASGGSDSLKNYRDETAKQMRRALAPKKTARRENERQDEPPISPKLNRPESPRRRSAASPFRALFEEFPEDEAAWRLLETLATGACEGNDADLRKFKENWRAFCSVLSQAKLSRAREEILRYLNERSTELVDYSFSDRSRLSEYANAVFDAIVSVPLD